MSDGVRAVLTFVGVVALVYSGLMATFVVGAYITKIAFGG